MNLEHSILKRMQDQSLDLRVLCKRVLPITSLNYLLIRVKLTKVSVNKMCNYITLFTLQWKPSAFESGIKVFITILILLLWPAKQIKVLSIPLSISQEKRKMHRNKAEGVAKYILLRHCKAVDACVKVKVVLYLGKSAQVLGDFNKAD